ncbi:type IV toxin-antitoxin system AbiEi family antitoxin domain-containing protein [Nocardioides terrisoli]|uniref:type IV toxin-antitoxin system AbiEi family antitoxin domain-containing protein n=1 Tax=Nocardioides terrisoli TaxID=3388267 RepID=UPI00287BB2DB|nr:type IV toxin-antitoxin system AbiEi family antitoxin domain-containing protein [Nocardioides marmorisolisilvae]
MADFLTLDLPAPLLDGPFTRSMAEAVGVRRAGLERMLRHGVLRRMLRGVYVGAHLQDTVVLRGQALALLVGPDCVAVDRTAAWLHGLATIGAVPGTLDVVGRRHRVGPFAARRSLSACDTARVAGVWVTTPLRTACDLARILPPGRALAVLDEVLRHGACTHTELVCELPRQARLAGQRQLRRLVAIADGRSANPAESALRLYWLEAGLPTPVPGLEADRGAGPVRLALAAPDQLFAVVLDEPGPGGAALTAAGWQIVRLARQRVLDGDPALVGRHLVREYHRQLLVRAG